MVLGLFKVLDFSRVVQGSGLLQAWLRGFGVYGRSALFRGLAGLFRSVNSGPWFRVVLVCFRFSGLFQVFGLFRVQGRSAVFRGSVGLNRVVSKGVEFRAVYVCFGFRFVQGFWGCFGFTVAQRCQGFRRLFRVVF